MGKGGRRKREGSWKGVMEDDVERGEMGQSERGKEERGEGSEQSELRKEELEGKGEGGQLG